MQTKGNGVRCGTVTGPIVRAQIDVMIGSRMWAQAVVIPHRSMPYPMDPVFVHTAPPGGAGPGRLPLVSERVFRPPLVSALILVQTVRMLCYLMFMSNEITLPVVPMGPKIAAPHFSVTSPPCAGALILADASMAWMAKGHTLALAAVMKQAMHPLEEATAIRAALHQVVRTVRGQMR